MLNFLSPSLIALLPLLITSATAILVMLFIAVRRNHWWNATLTVAGLNLALLAVVLVSLVVFKTGPQRVTDLLQVDSGIDGGDCAHKRLP